MASIYLCPIILLVVNAVLGVLIILASIFGDVMAGGPITYLQNLSSQGNFQAGVIFLIGAILIYVFIRVVNPSFEPKIKKRQKKVIRQAIPRKRL
ncbi:uncharacterized protein MONOS_12482 [Monocercomonoides exilis]|uniref:uncharacterized protein n=1 Tax=Monocercomonoides exilis TaxID=2049356 RepID=UPI003559EAB2|nr:hypothetical protein MONOS_12281 [Monocercomonoides exilis]KAH7821823.1 hypothetical protein MONOS_12482 [Monocercomonoides exilis]|eukprot:MONOS_12281.1-p1 / transcript=MONOS_12281.1 / gene=MONOS_12281 / organism=Monocercomonoides_exilis_PA203 / gene_product=unspecified product / transcript_product=unspecified product / location=Mono_scaffold00670:15147-15498(-) / protein_length=95 / sequence_SO=supercontig / SO=protein_coding / is_pseudo=false